jgi:hypothetical protein
MELDQLLPIVEDVIDGVDEVFGELLSWSHVLEQLPRLLQHCSDLLHLEEEVDGVGAALVLLELDDLFDLLEELLVQVVTLMFLLDSSIETSRELQLLLDLAELLGEEALS